jgi:hypothetical protein
MRSEAATRPRRDLFRDRSLALPYEALRCPPLGERDAATGLDPRARLENDLFLRIADLEEVVGVLDRLFAEFCALRGTSAWQARALPALRAWIGGL